MRTIGLRWVIIPSTSKVKDGTQEFDCKRLEAQAPTGPRAKDSSFEGPSAQTPNFLPLLLLLLLLPPLFFPSPLLVFLPSSHFLRLRSSERG